MRTIGALVNRGKASDISQRLIRRLSGLLRGRSNTAREARALTGIYSRTCSAFFV